MGRATSKGDPTSLVEINNREDGQMRANLEVPPTRTERSKHHLTDDKSSPGIDSEDF
jgi:hypothetical protein